MGDQAQYEKQPLLEDQRDGQPEPTLAELQQAVFQAHRKYMRAWSKTTSGKWHKRMMIGITVLLTLFVVLSFGVLLSVTDDDGGLSYPVRVPLEAHIMSKCPDAKDCLHDVILPAMQDVSHFVDFQLSYIGKARDSDDGVECKHGQDECVGNIIELCAAHLYPVKQSLGFTMCLTRQYKDIPKRSLVEDCALEHGISIDALNDCSAKDDGGMAVEMLRASFNRSASAGVTKSCTIRLDDKIWCIRDGGEWKDCQGGHTSDDLVKNVRTLFHERLG